MHSLVSVVQNSGVEPLSESVLWFLLSFKMIEFPQSGTGACWKYVRAVFMQNTDTVGADCIFTLGARKAKQWNKEVNDKATKNICTAQTKATVRNGYVICWVLLWYFRFDFKVCGYFRDRCNNNWPCCSVFLLHAGYYVGSAIWEMVSRACFTCCYETDLHEPVRVLRWSRGLAEMESVNLEVEGRGLKELCSFKRVLMWS